MATDTASNLSLATLSLTSSVAFKTTLSLKWPFNNTMSNLKKMKMEDRISLLTNSLIHRILSFLNTKQVVQTCVLSKRWKTLWTRIPTLNFNFYSYPFEESSSPNARRSKESSFKNFIFRILSEHCGTVKKLTYSSSKIEGEVVLVELLICYARCHNVRKLYLDIYYVDVYDWKYWLSACSSLTVLKMSCGFVDDWGVLSLPSLRILEIECDLGAHDDDADYKFSGCPNLESLVLINFLFESATICAPKLENLELCAGYVLNFLEVELMCASSLRNVTFSNILPTVKSPSEFSCIQKVNIEAREYEFTRGSDPQKSIRVFSELLRVFHNAYSFTLPWKAIQPVILSSVPFPSKGLCFHNMRHLKLRVDRRDKPIDFPINELAYLLKHPNLRTLTILDEENVYYRSLEF